MLSLCQDTFQSQRLIVQTDIRLSEILSAMSVALDITQGQPRGHSMRTALLGMRIADEIQLSSEDRMALFYALLLKDLGCSSNAAKISYLFGADDHAIKRSSSLIDWTSPIQRIKHCWSHCAAEGSAVQRATRLASMLRVKTDELRELAEIRCNRGAEVAALLELPAATADAIYHLDEHWDGSGFPRHLRGEEIPLLSRICSVSQTMEVFFTTHGRAVAVDVAQRRRGAWFDPELVDAALCIARDAEFWRRMLGTDLIRELRNWEPQDVVCYADEDTLDRIAVAFATVVDAKSPWTYEHSARVAEIAVGIAGELGCSDEVLRDVRRAGLLHDIGKLGVSNQILDKPGKPTEEEFQQIRKHTEWTQCILSQVDALRDLADVACAHHERLDGRGYHRGLDASNLPPVARILAVADICEAMTAKRPYRDAMSWQQTYALMQRDAGNGIDVECLDALCRWYGRAEFESRVESQLVEVERLLSCCR